MQLLGEQELLNAERSRVIPEKKSKPEIPSLDLLTLERARLDLSKRGVPPPETLEATLEYFEQSETNSNEPLAEQNERTHGQEYRPPSVDSGFVPIGECERICGPLDEPPAFHQLWPLEKEYVFDKWRDDPIPLDQIEMPVVITSPEMQKQSILEQFSNWFAASGWPDKSPAGQSFEEAKQYLKCYLKAAGSNRKAPREIRLADYAVLDKAQKIELLRSMNGAWNDLAVNYSLDFSGCAFDRKQSQEALTAIIDAGMAARLSKVNLNGLRLSSSVSLQRYIGVRHWVFPKDSRYTASLLATLSEQAKESMTHLEGLGYVPEEGEAAGFSDDDLKELLVQFPYLVFLCAHAANRINLVLSVLAENENRLQELRLSAVQDLDPSILQRFDSLRYLAFTDTPGALAALLRLDDGQRKQLETLDLGGDIGSDLDSDSDSDSDSNSNLDLNVLSSNAVLRKLGEFLSSCHGLRELTLSYLLQLSVSAKVDTKVLDKEIKMLQDHLREYTQLFQAINNSIQAESSQCAQQRFADFCSTRQGIQHQIDALERYKVAQKNGLGLNGLDLNGLSLIPAPISRVNKLSSEEESDEWKAAELMRLLHSVSPHTSLPSLQLLYLEGIVLPVFDDVHDFCERQFEKQVLVRQHPERFGEAVQGLPVPTMTLITIETEQLPAYCPDGLGRDFSIFRSYRMISTVEELAVYEKERASESRPYKKISK
ncbi:MAG: hypothetical protein V4623_05580 [Pseudomonadota bacterium]